MNLISQKYHSIGQCIYCGIKNENLTDEHVIPFALGGTMILRDSCCESCRDLTCRCERNPLNENWAEVRACLDYPSRRRNFKNEHFKLNVVLKNGESKTLDLKKEEVLGLAQFLEYDLPAIFRKEQYNGGITVTAFSNFIFGMNVDEFREKHNIKQFTYSVTHKNNYFETMLTKIAYTFTIACMGLECFEECFVLPSILRKNDDTGLWLGCDPDGKIVPSIGIQNGKNVLKIGTFKPLGTNKEFIIVRMKFFANTDTPEYIVVVGTLKENFKIQ